MGSKGNRKKYRENRKKLHREHLIGCQSAKLFLLKYVIITTITTPTVITVTIITVPIWLYEFGQNLIYWVLAQFEFLNFVTTWFLLPFLFKFWHNLSFCILSQFEFLSFVTFWVVEFCHHFFFKFCHNVFLIFVTISTFESCHMLIFF